MKLKKILLSIFNNLPMVLAGVALFTIIALEGMQAIGRYAFKQTFLFVDDIAVICFAWTICAGCAAAYQHKAHYGLDVLVNALKGKIKAVFPIVTQILTAAVFAYFFNYSIKLYQNVGPKILTTTLLSYRWVDAALIFGFGMMLIYNIVFLVQDIIALISPKKEDETV